MISIVYFASIISEPNIHLFQAHIYPYIISCLVPFPSPETNYFVVTNFSLALFIGWALCDSLLLDFETSKYSSYSNWFSPAEEKVSLSKLRSVCSLFFLTPFPLSSRCLSTGAPRPTSEWFSALQLSCTCSAAVDWQVFLLRWHLLSLHRN